MQLADFDYFLPDELIAKEPINPRDHSRLLMVNRTTQEITHHHFYDLPSFLNKGDCLVRNTTRVIPARIPTKTATGQETEVFLLKKIHEKPGTWQCLIKPGKRVKGPLELFLKDGTSITASKNSQSDFEVFIPPKADFWHWLETVGEPPLPPYLKRKARAEDTQRYQTVFSKESGSIAAPTAGLHFTEGLLNQLSLKGIQLADVLLHVGYGTFSPIRTEKIEDHQMHEEFYSISNETVSTLRKTRAAGHRVFALGTTSLRALESLPVLGQEGETRLYITPGYKFQEIDGLITNFHLPQSTLFILVCALLGTDLCKKVYQEAIERRYRFYSYGDAMLVV